jgi:hypothetical protein
MKRWAAMLQDRCCNHSNSLERADTRLSSLANFGLRLMAPLYLNSTYMGKQCQSVLAVYR